MTHHGKRLVKIKRLSKICLKCEPQKKALKNDKVIFLYIIYKNCSVKKSSIRKYKRLQDIDIIVILETLLKRASNVHRKDYS